jgi:hypothetical protein
MLVSADRFSHIHMGLVGLLHVSNGNTHLLIVVDHCPHWPETFPLASLSAAACPATLFGGRLDRLGVPTVSTSEGGGVYRLVVSPSLVLLGLRAAAKEPGSEPPSELFCSSQLLLPGDFITTQPSALGELFDGPSVVPGWSAAKADLA